MNKKRSPHTDLFLDRFVGVALYFMQAFHFQKNPQVFLRL